MSHLVTILRAAHCRSTHHYFALDALDRIETVHGKRLGQILLKYHHDYLTGAKAPDRSFRDFQNHVIHVNDNCWGGAPQACERWLAKTVEHLNHRRWKQAAYACGVLSHYFTDPLMPLHTDQCDQESVVHRPMEWSICQSYETIYQKCAGDRVRAQFELGSGPKWISKAVVRGATAANKHYARLIEIYDVECGTKYPPDGLNEESRERLAELFCIALTGWSRILARIADETTTEIPETSLALPTLLATLDMPLAWILRKVSCAAEQRAVQAIFTEYRATGAVRRKLPAEIKVVRRERAKQPDPPGQLVGSQAAIAVQKDATPPRSDARMPSPSMAAQIPAEKSSDAAVPPARVSLQSALIEAPSIGPKTARRFEKIGIRTIGQFVTGDASSLAEQLQTRWMTASLIVDWQAQARLVCDVPALCGYKAQLLVAVGCLSAKQLAESNVSELAGRIAALCQTAEGQRIVRSSQVPTLDDVAAWSLSASSRQSHRAA